ncbi:DNA repair protein XRCC3-like [Branchiostoma lanceolatum]|uniref:DNA repair protein XRCC3-like n=1 Tax=Branchiostoma lanceolatum TaxID=7740 RepID=UPI003451F0BB
MGDVQGLVLHPRILTAVRKAKLHRYEEVLRFSPADLERLTHLSAKDVGHLVREVSEAVRQRSHAATALQLLLGDCPAELKVKFLSLGCPVLDEFLRGGVPCQGLTEISGESSAGKTQFGLQLCLTVQLPEEWGGLNAGAVYICTEDAFPSKRLAQMAQQFPTRGLAPVEVTKKTRFSDQIFVEHTADKDQLSKCIQSRLPILLERGVVKLVVIDSIAALFRGEYESRETARRAKDLQSLGAQLRKVSQKYSVLVVCINQVSAVVGKRRGNGNISSSQKVIPALGLVWSSLVTTRLMVTRTEHTVQCADGSPAVVRSLEVLFSPHLPNTTQYYIVDAQGVKGLR